MQEWFMFILMLDELNTMKESHRACPVAVVYGSGIPRNVSMIYLLAHLVLHVNLDV